MQVNFNFCQPNNNFFNVSATNNRISNENTTVRGAKSLQRRDKVNLSPQGKMMQTIENLVKQKESIAEQRGELIGRTLEAGKELKTIEHQLESYDDQLNAINKQIKQLSTDMAKSITDVDDKKKKTSKADQDKTEEEARTEHLSNIANVSENIKNSETVSSVKRKAEGEIKVKESEIEIGKVFIDHLESKAKMSGAKVADMVSTLSDIIEGKNEEIEQLEAQVSSLGNSQMSKLGDVSEQLQQSGEKVFDSKDEQVEQDTIA